MRYDIELRSTPDVNALTRVTAVIPTHPARGDSRDPSTPLGGAFVSVLAQSVSAYASIACDRTGTGAAETRNCALDMVGSEEPMTPWVAFLDSDDEWMPHHLATLLQAAEETGADVVYPWPEMAGGRDPCPQHFGVPFDPDALRRYSYIPVTSLVRTELAQAARFGPPDHAPDSLYDDWGFYLRCLDLGATFHHVPERTWIWHIHSGNTSGQADRGDAR